MRNIKKLFGFFLSLVFVLSFVLSTPVVAQAAEKYYSVSFALGNNKDASFDSGKVKDLMESKDLGYDFGAKKITVKAPIGNSQTLTQDEIEGLINITGDEFAFEGLKVSGADKTFTGDVSLNKDETYIAAFGIKSIISYNVSYVDSKGNAVASPVTLYAAKGEKIRVPAEQVKGHVPNQEYIEEKLVKDGQEFKFVYDEPTEVIHTTVKTETNTKYVKGSTTYSYDYQYVDGGTEVSTSTTNNPTVVNNRREHRDNGTTDNGTTTTTTTTASTNGAGNEGSANAGGEGEDASAAQGGDTTTIGEGDTPLAGGDGTTIPEGEPPKAGEKEHLIRTLMVTIFILILVIITTIIIAHVTYQKRQQTIEDIEKRDNTPKRF
ncbi:hypothetical protein SAMN02910298_01706 [Pseudobutyrivibrio sp. YE44]|uniref:hypothetical protein n=1 Tax=Pseudobutyrivibrio sp. YE44 TaxID=1520802 RepID=UPI00088C0C19|nr:hypothetical protein [Pseudobutyrivibrio sp. YE44]SDB34881.1 hypothetical protein SAMN02910298_01706 [Pseudobutyrivibrio sp. YE44]